MKALLWFLIPMNVMASGYFWGGSSTSIISPTTAFGELSVAESTPSVQIDAVYGQRDGDDTQSLLDTLSSGSAGVSNGTTGNDFYASTGTNAAGMAHIHSKFPLRYHAGQGMNFRITCRFPSGGVANSEQICGAMNTGNALAFGYNGTAFGALLRTGGLSEIRTLTVSAGAGGSENATVTLNGVAQVVALTAGTAKHACVELAAATYPGWDVYSNGSTVVWVNKLPGAKSGTFSISSTGTATGSFARTNAGVATTDTWIPQTEWNIDKMDGAGSSGQTLNPAKGNIFEITAQYLGYGAIVYSVEDAVTGKLIPVHRVRYANANTAPSIKQPIFRVGWGVENMGNTSNISIYGASAAASLQGNHFLPRNPDAVGTLRTNIGTSLTNIISIRNRYDFNSQQNLNDVLPKNLSVSTLSSAGSYTIVRLLINAVVAGDPDWTYVDSAKSSMEYDLSTGVVTLGSNTKEAGYFTVNGQQMVNLDLSRYNIRLARGEKLTVAVQGSATQADTAASVTWNED